MPRAASLLVAASCALCSLAGARSVEGATLRVKNASPFILQVFIGGVRAGWLKPFRTELFNGLRAGTHRVFLHSEYGTVAWGPRDVHVPGQLRIALEARDIDTALAARIYQANRASLIACGKLAERRGESVRGTRAEFEVSVSERGEGLVRVSGAGLSEGLTGCYRAVATQWKFDVTGRRYELSFVHVN
jgi:hypothetical protein